MKYNTQEVADLQPNYLGFIFWGPSKRYFEGEMPKIPENIKKIGVFVDAKIDDIIEKIVTFDLWGVQLHGNESAEYCEKLKNSFLSFRAESRKKKTTMKKEATVRSSTVETSGTSNLSSLKIIKVFPIKDDFDFEQLQPYEAVCDYYLFDTKGKLPGGNGYTFNWEVLKNYPSTKPYFLSGGIGLEEIDALNAFMKLPEAKYCHVIDVNSKFEDAPGMKNIEKLKKFKNNFPPI